MDQAKLVNRLGRANGIAARVLGTQHDLFRSPGPMNPLSLANRVLRLPASFNAQDMTYTKPPSYGHAVYFGVFDNTATQAGDYLSSPAGTWFIAAQVPLLPVLCVLTNRLVSLGRPVAPSAAGSNSYGGVTTTTATLLASNWPASVLAGGGGQAGILPSDASIPYWSILLPAMPVAFRSADLLIDDLGRTFVVSSAEQSALGWRLTVSQAAT